MDDECFVETIELLLNRLHLPRYQLRPVLADRPQFSAQRALTLTTFEYGEFPASLDANMR